MEKKKSLQQVVSSYLADSKALLLTPAGFFKVLCPASNWHWDAAYAFPPIFVFANIMAALKLNPFWILLWVPAAYLSLAFWIFVLKRVLSVFGEEHSLDEIGAIGSRTSLAFVLGWIPEYGFLISFLVIAFWSYKCLVSRFGMNNGAAVAAVCLPVVICGMFGITFSYIFIWLASLSTLIK